MIALGPIIDYHGDLFSCTKLGNQLIGVPMRLRVPQTEASQAQAVGHPQAGFEAPDLGYLPTYDTELA